jgi:hypothetical protein
MTVQTHKLDRLHAPGHGSQKHHYIPEFYLKRWAGLNGQLCEFAHRYRGVAPRMTHPGGTGYEMNLYSIPSLGAALANVLEDRFFKTTDQFASDALMAFEVTETVDLSADLRSGWSRFIRSLQERAPDRLAWLKEEWRRGMTERHKEIERSYATWRLPGDPLTFAEARKKLDEQHGEDKSWAILLHTIIDSQEVGSFLNGMRWNLLKIVHPSRTFLTSDRPVVTSNGIAYTDSSIAIPIGPNRLFVAVNNVEGVARLRSMDPDKVMTWMNDRIVKQARKFVYGVDARQLRFIEGRLPRPSEGKA